MTSKEQEWEKPSYLQKEFDIDYVPAERLVDFISQTHKDLLTSLLAEMPEERHTTFYTSLKSGKKTSRGKQVDAFNEALHTIKDIITKKIESI